MNPRIPFPLPAFPKDRPINQHPFYQWLIDKEGRLDTRDAGALVTYLNEQGVDFTHHCIDPDVDATLRTVHDYYRHTWMPTREVHAASALFTEGSAKDYWIRSLPGYSHGVPTPLLVGLIASATPTYALSPVHYYFEVVNDTLFINYQHIIGHRRLCRVEAAL